MHLAISWDIKDVENDKWKSINSQLKECLNGFSWVKPLTTFYIVKIDGPDERKDIRESLISVCKKNPKIINVIISPIMEGGKYAGWLPSSMWDKIRERTDEENCDE